MPKKIVIPPAQLWDKKNEKFVYTKETMITVEHSLVSLSKWESKWHKPFLGNNDKTTEETIDYIRCMTLTQNVDPDCYKYLTQENVNDIVTYINDPMTATWFGERGNHKPNDRRIITNELIYYWMIMLNIPFECQKWHLNRLMTLIRVCNEENKPKNKLSRKQLYSRNAKLNAARRAKLKSKG